MNDQLMFDQLMIDQNTKDSMQQTYMRCLTDKIIHFMVGDRTRTRLWSVMGLLLLFLTPVGLDPAEEEGLREFGHWLNLPSNVAKADVVVVMGGDVQQRLTPGVELFEQGFAPKLWYTGGDVPASMALAQAVEMGVPAEATAHLLGTSTWEETEQVAIQSQEQGLHSVLIVTSWYHGRRTLCSLRQHLQGADVQIYYQPVGYDDYGPDNWWLTETGRKLIFSEMGKLGYYWLNYGLVPQNC